MNKYPKASTVVWIMAWCDKHGLNPCEFYENEFLRDPRAWALMSMFQSWKAQKEEERMEKSRSPQPPHVPRFAR